MKYKKYVSHSGLVGDLVYMLTEDSLNSIRAILICTHCGRNIINYRHKKHRGYMIYKLKNHTCKARLKELTHRG